MKNIVIRPPLIGHLSDTHLYSYVFCPNSISSANDGRLLHRNIRSRVSFQNNDLQRVVFQKDVEYIGYYYHYCPFYVNLETKLLRFSFLLFFSFCLKNSFKILNFFSFFFDREVFVELIMKTFALSTDITANPVFNILKSLRALRLLRIIK